MLERVVRAAPDATLLLDPDGLITAANSTAHRLFGMGEAELLKRPLSGLVVDPSGGPILGGFARRSRAPEDKAQGAKIEVQARCPGDAGFACELTLVPIDSDSGPCTLITVIDTSERPQALATQNYLAAIVQNAGDAIISKDLHGVIRSWNPAAERLLGYRSEEIVGEPVTRLIPDDRLAEETMILEKICSGQQVPRLETLRRRRDGSLVEVSLTVSPVKDRHGKVVAASKVMHDISERRRSEAALRQAYVDLAEINAELDAFVQTASHDLRAPLLGISSVVGWVLEDDKAICEATRARLKLVAGRVDRLERLLADLRNYVRAGKFSAPSGELLSAEALVADVVATLHVPAGFTITGDASLAGYLVHRVPLEMVLHNLLGNAIKHHDRSSGTVTTAARPLGPWIHFTVIDDGPGIPDDYSELIFGMFQTLKPRDEVEGSGMGLALVRKIVNRVGGSCGVERHTGRGAHFWFDWPRASRG
jgi:PAS domain S-box-containing protein